MEPLGLLLIGLIFIAFLLTLFYPEKGIIPRVKRNKSNTTRVLIEDALKYIYDCEYNRVTCNVNSIAGNLHIPSDHSAKLVDILKGMNLIDYDSEKIWLTGEGRSYALKVIRIHRLWEKYLADETGLNEMEWHSSAELAEHTLSAEDADKLAARIGHPVIDPHGDPIPTAEGEIKEKRGEPLPNLETGEQARIVHIEDEPQSVYSQIVASGIHNGMELRVTESTDDKIKFIAEGEEIVLSRLIASNLTVIKERHESEFTGDLETLESLRTNEEARVLGISKSCRGAQRRRLMDLGIVRGSRIKYEMSSPGGDPVAYEVRGSTIVLRNAQAKQIFISRNGG